MRIVLSLIAAMALTAACADEPVPPAGDAAAPTALAPVLAALTRADFEPELASGAGCTLARDGEDLIVAVVGDAVARPDGRLVHLQGGGSDLNRMAYGGRYSSGDIQIDIALAPDLGEGDAAGGQYTKPVRVTVQRDAASGSFEAAWTCGS